MSDRDGPHADGGAAGRPVARPAADPAGSEGFDHLDDEPGDNNVEPADADDLGTADLDEYDNGDTDDGEPDDAGEVVRRRWRRAAAAVLWATHRREAPAPPPVALSPTPAFPTTIGGQQTPPDPVASPCLLYGQVDDGEGPSFVLGGQLGRHRLYEALPPSGGDRQLVAVGNADDITVSERRSETKARIGDERFQALAMFAGTILVPMPGSCREDLVLELADGVEEGARSGVVAKRNSDGLHRRPQGIVPLAGLTVPPPPRTAR